MTTNLLTLHPHSSKREPSRPVSTHPPPTYLPIVTIKDKSNHNSCLKIRVATYLLAAIQAEKHKRDIHSLTHERCLPFKGLINLAKFITSCRKRFFTTKYDKAKKRCSFWHRSKVTNYLSKQASFCTIMCEHTPSLNQYKSTKLTVWLYQF